MLSLSFLLSFALSHSLSLSLSPPLSHSFGECPYKDKVRFTIGQKSYFPKSCAIFLVSPLIFYSAAKKYYILNKKN